MCGARQRLYRTDVTPKPGRPEVVRVVFARVVFVRVVFARIVFARVVFAAPWWMYIRSI